MNVRIALPLIAVIGVSLNCALCTPIVPGVEGDQCTFDSDCGAGLRCIHDKCAPVTADAGPTDAATSDGQRDDLAGADLVGRDLTAVDHGVTDHAAADGAVPDQVGVDVVALDQLATDHHAVDGTAPDLGLGDVNWRFDYGHPDHPRPDVTGIDWTGRDLNVFVEGGIVIDAGLHGYDGGYEPGVACGSLTCNGTQHCCLGLGPTFSCADTCVGAIADLGCDDTQDCGNNRECCGTGLNTFCIATGTCLSSSSSNYLVCTSGTDCATHSMVCCSASLFTGTGVELGWCQLGTCQ